MNATNTTEVQRHLETGWLIILAIVAVLGTVGNLLIIAAVCLSQRLRVKGHAFTVNLAIADLIVTCYIMPFGLAASRSQQQLPNDEGLCGFNAFLIMTTCGASTQSLMLIAIERYFHICKTAYYGRFFSKHLIGVYIAIAWVYSAIWTCHGWTGWTRYLYGLDIWVCLFDGTYSVSYNVCLVFFGMVLPMAVLFFCYIKIFMLVHKNNQSLKKHRLNRPNGTQPYNKDLTDDQKRSKKEFRLTVTLVVIVLVFCVSWTPASIVLLMSGVWTSMPKLFYTIAVWLAFANSSMNSVLYGFLNKNFRDGYKRVILAMFCCKRQKCHNQCLTSEELSSSSKQHSNETAKTDTLSKKKTMIIKASLPNLIHPPRPNSISDIRIDPVELWSPDEVDRSCRYVKHLEELQGRDQEMKDIDYIDDHRPASSNSLHHSSDNLKSMKRSTSDIQNLEDCNPPTPGTVDMPSRPPSCRSRVTTIMHMNEGVIETQF